MVSFNPRLTNASTVPVFIGSIPDFIFLFCPFNFSPGLRTKIHDAYQPLLCAAIYEKLFSFATFTVKVKQQTETTFFLFQWLNQRKAG